MECELTLVDSLDAALELKRWLGRPRDVLAVDLETSGLRWWQDRVRLVQLGDADHGWAIPCDEFRGWPALVRELLADYRAAPIVGHDFIRFDKTFLEQQLGVRIPISTVEDTLLLATLAQPRGQHGLKDLATKHVDPTAYVGQATLGDAMARQRWTWETVPTEFTWYWTYACMDVVLNARLWQHYRATFPEELRPAYSLELRVQEVLRKAAAKGLRADLEYAARAAEKLRDYAEQVGAWCEATYGAKPGTNADVASVLMRETGWRPWKFTEKGAPSLDKEVLSSIDHPLADQVLAYRSAQKIASSYFAKLPELAHGDVVHPNIKSMGAQKTHRMSASEPSMHNLPRSATVRDVFLASEGCGLVLADYEQIEFRMLAGLSQDPGLVAACTADVDPFTALTRLIHGDPTIEKGDPRRQSTKNAGYAKSYGSGVEKFAKTAGCSVEVAAEILADWDRTLPGTVDFMRRVEAKLRERLEHEGEAYVVGMDGRRLPVDRGKLYTGVNYKIQGDAATVLKIKLVDLDKTWLGEFFRLPVHDEVVLDVPLEAVEDVQRELPEVMNTTVYGVPVPVEPAGPYGRWGDKYR